MDVAFFLQILTLLFGFYMAWNIGANDVANAMGTSVGSKALSLKQAVIFAAILEFSGAFFGGGAVSKTIQKGIVNPEIFAADPMVFVLGMLGSLLATGLLLQLASFLGLPISTTHAIVGAVLGFGAAIGGFHAVHWEEVGKIASSWILSPILSGIISYFIFYLIQRKVLFALNPIEATQKIAPYFAFFSIFILSLSLLYHGLSNPLSPFYAFALSVVFGLIAAIFTLVLAKKIPDPPFQLSDGFHPSQAVSLDKALYHLQKVHLSNQSEQYKDQISHILTEAEKLQESVKRKMLFQHSSSHYAGVEKIFVYLQILSACLVAFAHGANDVANAIGPVAAVFDVLKTKTVGSHAVISPWLLALGGLGIVIGLASWGWRVIETIGKKITELTPTRGFSAELGAAITILIASKLGLPISTTHALVGAVFGVGMARGLRALNLQMLREIVVSWAVTLPLCALLSVMLFYLLNFFFL